MVVGSGSRFLVEEMGRAEQDDEFVKRNARKSVMSDWASGEAKFERDGASDMQKAFAMEIVIFFSFPPFPHNQPPPPQPPCPPAGGVRDLLGMRRYRVREGKERSRIRGGERQNTRLDLHSKNGGLGRRVFVIKKKKLLFLHPKETVDGGVDCVSSCMEGMSVP